MDARTKKNAIEELTSDLSLAKVNFLQIQDLIITGYIRNQILNDQKNFVYSNDILQTIAIFFGLNPESDSKNFLKPCSPNITSEIYQLEYSKIEECLNGPPDRSSIVIDNNYNLYDNYHLVISYQ
ncbi:MAG: hypothetical protein HRU35_04685 [Rickettsiaceae bacterium]|nr:hypothetical protein [Rickettsiaceae bacterium]